MAPFFCPFWGHPGLALIAPKRQSVSAPCDLPHFAFYAEFGHASDPIASSQWFWELMLAMFLIACFGNLGLD